MKTNKLFGMLLALSMMAPGQVFATENPEPETIDVTQDQPQAEKEGIWVGDAKMAPGNFLSQGSSSVTTNKPSDHYAYLSEDGKTLTLHNFSYTGKGYGYPGIRFDDHGYPIDSTLYAGLCIRSDITLKLEGTNVVSGDDYSISAYGKIAITGDSQNDSLETQKGIGDIYLGETATLTLSASNCTLTQNGMHSDSMTLDHVELNSTNGEIISRQNLQIMDSHLDITTGGTAISASGPFTIDNSTVRAISTGTRSKTRAASGSLTGIYANDTLLIRNSDITAQGSEGAIQIKTSTDESNAPVIEISGYPNGYVIKAGEDESSAKEITINDLGTQKWAHIAPKSNTTKISMNRLYNPNSGEHFYTANYAEKDNLVKLGWKYEGTGWTAPDSGDPVYRLYNPNAGDHHYTTSAAERDHLVKVGWKYEGVGWYSDTNKAVPLYRQYNPNAAAGAHNYTTSKAENDHLIKMGWKAEGIAWYGLN